MKRLPLFALLAGLVLAGSTFSPADEAKRADDGAKLQKKEAKGRTPRLIQPWSRLGSLNDEQKEQIIEIHRKALAQIKEIKEQEEADILALLTDEQKQELEKIKDDEAAERKAKSRAKNAKGKAEAKADMDDDAQE